MQTVFGLDSLKIDWPGCVTCIGTFDGVHLGHAAVIGETVRHARTAGLPAVALTFDRHPSALLSPDNAPPRLLSPAANLKQMCILGLDVVIIIAFERAFSEISAQAFLTESLIGNLKTVQVCVGHDFAFGHKREGSAKWLAENIRTSIVSPLELDGIRISSTEIRRNITMGELQRANEMLGRTFVLSGVVTRGQGLGRQLGVPTANLSLMYSQVLPKSGIYAGRAHLGGKTYLAAISVGDRPTVQGAGFAVEAHFLDYSGEDAYGRSLDLEFEIRLRDEVAFNSTRELVNQMMDDIADTRRILVNNG